MVQITKYSGEVDAFNSFNFLCRLKFGSRWFFIFAKRAQQKNQTVYSTCCLGPGKMIRQRVLEICNSWGRIVCIVGSSNRYYCSTPRFPTDCMMSFSQDGVAVSAFRGKSATVASPLYSILILISVFIISFR